MLSAFSAISAAVSRGIRAIAASGRGEDCTHFQEPGSGCSGRTLNPSWDLRRATKLCVVWVSTLRVGSR
jgi:hypothetical protein